MCGRRLSLQFSKGTYTYFYCLGQKDRRNGTGCRERYVAADQLEAEVEDLYGRLEVPTDWAEGLREAVAAEVASRHEDTTAERDLLATQHERLESERYKLMEAYYANAIATSPCSGASRSASVSSCAPSSHARAYSTGASTAGRT